MPRPKADNPRTAVVRVRFTPSERAELKHRALFAGVSVSEYTRRAALGRVLPAPPVPAINREAYSELARTAANLNQIVYHLNRGESELRHEADALRRVLVEATEQVRRLRLELVGVTPDDR